MRKGRGQASTVNGNFCPGIYPVAFPLRKDDAIMMGVDLLPTLPHAGFFHLRLARPAVYLIISFAVSGWGSGLGSLLHGKCVYFISMDLLIVSFLLLVFLSVWGNRMKRK